MTTHRIAGPLGCQRPFGNHDASQQTAPLNRPLSQFAPGSLGLHLGPVIFAAPKKSKIPPQKKLKNALIIIGAGQDELSEGIRYKGRKYFKQAALDAFKPLTKSHNVKIEFVKSATEMNKLLEGSTWNVVVYFGHGILNRQELMPGYGASGPTFKRDDFASALKMSSTTKVYLFGCNAGYTGLARSLSKQLPGVTVHGTFGELDVEWRQSGTEKTITENKFLLKEPLVEYKSGFRSNNGVKTKKRRREITDPISLDGDPLGEDLIDQ